MHSIEYREIDNPEKPTGYSGFQDGNSPPSDYDPACDNQEFILNTPPIPDDMPF
jgi:hypothetical protein